MMGAHPFDLPGRVRTIVGMIDDDTRDWPTCPDCKSPASFGGPFGRVYCRLCEKHIDREWRPQIAPTGAARMASSQNEEDTMKLKSIKIALTADWQRKTMGEYTATAEVEGGTYNDNISVTIDPERCEQIVSIMAGAVAESMQRAAAAFCDDVKARIGGQVIDQAALGDRSDGVKDDGPTAA